MKIWRFIVRKDKAEKIGLWYHLHKKYKDGLNCVITKRITLKNNKMNNFLNFRVKLFIYKQIGFLVQYEYPTYHQRMIHLDLPFISITFHFGELKLNDNSVLQGN